MNRTVERLAQTPGRMGSQSAQRERAHPLCPLRHVHPEDLELTLCEALTDDAKRLPARVDQESFQLHLQFVRAHGLPKGEVTLLSTGGGLSSGSERLL